MTKPCRRVSPTTGKMREIRSDDKFDDKYTKELLSGIRYKKKLSVPQLCRRWRISSTTYKNWKDKYPEFKEAAEIAQMDYEAYRWEVVDKLSTGELKGNAGAAIFGLEHSDKSTDYNKTVNVNNKHEEQIQTINIKVLPRKETRVIEADKPKQLEDNS